MTVLEFEPSLERVRPARFRPRPSIALERACALGAALRETLASALGAPCALAVGEPVALDPAAWWRLGSGALLVLLPGRTTDIVVALPHDDARALIAGAFHEEPGCASPAWTTLEAGAIERLLARGATAWSLLGGQSREPARVIDPSRLPRCCEAFDLRLSAPIRATLVVGITRALPEPAVAGAVPLAALGEVTVPLQLVLGRAVLAASRVVGLRVGDVVRLDTKVVGAGELNLAGQRMAWGTVGVVDGHVAFDVQTTRPKGELP